MPHRLLARIGLPVQLANALCVTGRFSAPAMLGVGGGVSVIEISPWAHPYAVFVLTSAVIQLFIALLRAWFTERRELMETLATQLDKQEGRFVRRLEEEAVIRHEQANQLQQQAYLIYCYQKGIDPTNPPPPLYDTEKEREMLRAGEEIHRTKSAGV